MEELNNLTIVKLPQVLKKETLMEGYWSLINDAQINCDKLYKAGIECSTMLFDVITGIGKTDLLIEETGISKSYILSLYSLLSHHSFKPVTLSKIEGIDFEIIKSLESKGIKNTGTLLILGKAKNSRMKLSGETNIPVNDLEKILAIADIMRKPGIKATKTKLFTAMGINSLAELGKQDPIEFRLLLQDFINRTGIVKAIPTPKEIITDIMWSRLYPQIIES